MKAGIKLTKPGLSFLGLIFLFYNFTLISEIGLLFIIIGIIIGCYFVNVISAYRTIQNISINDIGTIRPFEKRRISSAVEILNKSKSQSGFFCINSLYGIVSKIGSIPGKSRRHIAPELVFQQRGVYKIENLILESTFPFGLIKVNKTIKSQGEFIVYPLVYDCYPPHAAGFEPMFGGSFTGKHKVPYGNEFAGIRPFQSDDSVRQIQWKASSKGLGLMVKEYTEELSGKISFIIEPRNILLKNNESIGNLAVRASGSLILSALDAGHNIEICDVSMQHVMHIPPFADTDLILEYLARLNDEQEPYKKEKIDSALLSMSRVSSVCFVLSSINNSMNESIYSLLHSGRSVNLYLPHNSLSYKNKDLRISDIEIANFANSGVRIKFYTEESIL